MLKVRIPWNTGKQFCAEEQCFECEPIIGSVTSLRPGLLVGRLVCLGKLHFHAPIGALVFLFSSYFSKGGIWANFTHIVLTTLEHNKS